jgi:hypothetical protein
VGGKGEGRGKRGEMTQTLYAHMNKDIKNKVLLECIQVPAFKNCCL